jgi:hypothetical protein
VNYSIYVISTLVNNKKGFCKWKTSKTFMWAEARNFENAHQWAYHGEKYSLAEPGVNAGPKTACGGQRP